MSTVSPLLFLILIPLVAAVLVMLGGKSRTVSLFASASNLILLLVLATKFRPSEAGFQFVSSFPVVPQLGINFILGADGLSFSSPPPSPWPPSRWPGLRWKMTAGSTSAF